MSGKEYNEENQLSPVILAWVDHLRAAFVGEEVAERMIAVSEMEVNRSNYPTLPICMSALVDVTFRHAEKTNREPTVVEQIVTEFWFKSNKIRMKGNVESPFWAYYDYHPLLTKVVTAVLDFKSPQGFKFKITRMDLESDEAAVHITFEFFHEWEFCLPENELGEPVRIIPHVRVNNECQQTQIGV